MARGPSFQSAFPLFRGSLRIIILAHAAIWVALVLMASFAPQKVIEWIEHHAVLTPADVIAGQLWQLVTYVFLEVDPLGFFLVMLGVYFIGGAVYQAIGSRRFAGLYFGSVVAAGAFGVVVSFTKVFGSGGAAGAGVALNALLMVFYLVHREASVMPMFIPIPIPVKYVVIFTAVIETALLFLNKFALQYVVLLSGLGAGYLWHRFIYSRRISFSLGERGYAVRNAYYRWKRRRASKKFQVYMKKHNTDVYFDESGNYQPPDDKGKKSDRGSDEWVN